MGLLRRAAHKRKKGLLGALFHLGHKAPQNAQPPLVGRLPGFFLERVATPRSRLTR